MKKKTMFIVDNGTYPFDILVCIGSSHVEIKKRIEKTGYKLSQEEEDKLWMNGNGRTVMLLGGQTILRVDLIKGKAKFHANMAHEIFHAVEFLFNRIGLFYDLEKSSEAFAYQIAYLTGSIYERLDRQKGKK